VIALNPPRKTHKTHCLPKPILVDDVLCALRGCESEAFVGIQNAVEVVHIETPQDDNTPWGVGWRADT
jgi:hypothetical protein